VIIKSNAGTLTLILK